MKGEREGRGQRDQERKMYKGSEAKRRKGERSQGNLRGAWERRDIAASAKMGYDENSACWGPRRSPRSGSLRGLVQE